MWTKALVLGALPVPFTGAWVTLEGCEVWRCRVEPHIPVEILDSKVRLDVELSNGNIIAVVPSALKLAGKRVRLVVEEAFEGVRSFSAFIEEVES